LEALKAVTNPRYFPVIPALHGDLRLQMNSIRFEEFFTLPTNPAQSGDNEDKAAVPNTYAKVKPY
jgi:hypothetical protein